MMTPNLTAPISIINLIELGLSVIIGGLIGNLNVEILMDYQKLQVINATSYGYLIVNIVVVGSIILQEELPKKARTMIAGSAVAMYVTTGSLIINMFVQDKNALIYAKSYHDRILTAGTMSIFLAVVYIVDLVFLWKR